MSGLEHNGKGSAYRSERRNLGITARQQKRMHKRARRGERYEPVRKGSV